MCGCHAFKKDSEHVVVAYVTSWTDEIPDPFVMTHINYAFGHVNDTFDGVRVDNPDRLAAIVALNTLNQYLDFVNIMTYDMGKPPYHNAALYPSSASKYSCDEAVEKHHTSGMPYEKLSHRVSLLARIIWRM